MTLTCDTCALGTGDHSVQEIVSDMRKDLEKPSNTWPTHDEMSSAEDLTNTTAPENQRAFCFSYQEYVKICNVKRLNIGDEA